MKELRHIKWYWWAAAAGVLVIAYLWWRSRQAAPPGAPASSMVAQPLAAPTLGGQPASGAAALAAGLDPSVEAALLSEQQSLLGNAQGILGGVIRSQESLIGSLAATASSHPSYTLNYSYTAPSTPGPSSYAPSGVITQPSAAPPPSYHPLDSPFARASAAVPSSLPPRNAYATNKIGQLIRAGV